MAQNRDSQDSRRKQSGTPEQLARAPHVRLLPRLSPQVVRPLPPVVPLLWPNQTVTPAQDALLTTLAQRARLGDDVSRDLLWRAFAARLEPALLTVGRMTWHTSWARRNGRPWELDDLHQEAWLVFVELVLRWDGEGSFVPYLTAYFPWRLRNAMRRIAPPRRAAAPPRIEEPDTAALALLDAIEAKLSPAEQAVLRLRLQENAGICEIARRLGINRRTVSRRWARICRVAREVTGDGNHA